MRYILRTLTSVIRAVQAPAFITVVIASQISRCAVGTAAIRVASYISNINTQLLAYAQHCGIDRAKCCVAYKYGSRAASLNVRLIPLIGIRASNGNAQSNQLVPC